MKRSNSDDFLMTAIIMAEAHGNCCSDNALYKNGLLLLLLLLLFNFCVKYLIVKRTSGMNPGHFIIHDLCLFPCLRISVSV